MQAVLARFGLDYRFLQLTAFVMVGTWLFVSVLSLGLLVVLGWRIILFHQVVAWPFSVIGWAAGFQIAQALGLGGRISTLISGWSALILAEIGTAQVVNLWSGTGGALSGLVVFPVLAVLTTIGVLWLYSDDTRLVKAQPQEGGEP